MGSESDSPEPSDNEEINWSKCRAVEQSKELGWVLKGYPTVPADAILESVGRGLDVEQIGEHFGIPAEAARLVVYYAIPGYHWIACPGVEQDGSDNPFIVGTNVPAEAVKNLYDHNLSYGKIAQRLSLSEHQVRAIIEFRYPLLPDEFGYDWTGCEEVVQVRGMRGGVPILKRIRFAAGLVASLFEDGYSPARICASYGVSLEQVKRVLEFAFAGQRFSRTGIDWNGCSEVVRCNCHRLQPWCIEGTYIDPDVVVELFKEAKLDTIRYHHIPEHRIQGILTFAVS